ncbi:hypothetical protein FRC20_011459 [Serendipita sp. 405]|nr:hypothetical protein FRC15_011350 [Serendipita sp. 397]KAG8861507.1 hypothetical protein FRC20_011459 [Serendipita sp. 405]
MDRPTTQISALSLIPAEIWQEIFDLALFTWLLPGDGTNLLDDLKLFQRGCTSHQEYRRVEHIRCSLCAVCWQWNQLLQNRNIKLVVSSLKYYAHPYLTGEGLASTQRMETFGRCASSCDGTCGSRRINDAIQTQYEKNCIRIDRSLEPIQPPQIDFTHMTSLRVLVQDDGVGVSRNNLDNLTPIYSAPLLRAVSMSMDLFEWDLPMPTLLTHLHLQCNLYAQHTLQLPHLKFFSIHLSIVQKKTSPGNDNDTDADADAVLVPCPFDRWDLPNLVTLRLSGTLNKEGWGYIRQMIVNCSPTLVNLVSTFELSVPEPNTLLKRLSPLPIVCPMLRFCPRLAVFGTTISCLLQPRCDPSADVHNPLGPIQHSKQSTAKLSFLLLGMDTVGGTTQLWIEVLGNILEREGRLDIIYPPGDKHVSPPFGRLLLPFKWSEIGPTWDETHQRETETPDGFPIPHPSVEAWVIFRAFIARGVKIVDAAGIELHDENGGGKKLFESAMCLLTTEPI